ncbi:VOC family protein [Streptomyces sp. BI20]|uniref:VOC family protein n=1 Tax=Streptomyces sp. BI20 TaxID=3403460 RepID=UPI003C710B6E
MFRKLVHHITVDARDPWAQALFWSGVTGWPLGAEDRPGDPEVELVPGSPDASGLLFIRVPEEKTVKNRLHLDLSPTERTRDEEVTRILALGARLLDDRREPDGTGWAVLADPEGNEFCVVRGPAERAARAAAAQ